MMRNWLFKLERRLWRRCPDLIRVPLRSTMYPLIRFYSRGKLSITVDGTAFQMWHKNNSEYWNLRMAPQYEPEFLREFMQAIQKTPEPVVLYDIGANVGFYSCVAAAYSRAIKKESSIVAFEPDAMNFRDLRENLTLNTFDNVMPLQFAVGDGEENGGVVTLSGEGATTHLSTAEVSDNVSENRVAPIVSVDTLVKRKKIPLPNVIKMDIEGYEYKALQGMKYILSISSPLILLEVHPDYLVRFGASISALEELMKHLGYECIQLHKRGSGESFGHQQEHVKCVKQLV